MIIRVVIRGYAAGKVQFEDRVLIADTDLEKLLPDVAERHAKAMAEHRLHYIEFEFLDEPDPNQRFFRFGTDPSGMVMPIEVDL
jgi:hypothetical protein